jgi:hypothetical protein
MVPKLFRMFADVLDKKLPKTRRGWWVLGGLALITIMSAAINSLTENWVDRWVFSPIWNVLSWLTALPIGWVGLALLVYVIVILTVTGIEMSPGLTAKRERKSVDLNTLRAERDQARVDAKKYRWLYEYGQHPPDVRNTTAEEIDAVRVEISRWATELENLSKALEAVSDEMTRRLYMNSPYSVAYEYAATFHRDVVGNSRRLLALLRKSDGEDTRRVFQAFYEEYLTLRDAAAKIAAYEGYALADLNSFSAWRNADAAFLTRVSNLPNVGPFVRLRDFVATHDKDERRSFAALEKMDQTFRDRMEKARREHEEHCKKQGWDPSPPIQMPWKPAPHISAPDQTGAVS